MIRPSLKWVIAMLRVFDGAYIDYIYTIEYIYYIYILSFSLVWGRFFTTRCEIYSVSTRVTIQWKNRWYRWNKSGLYLRVQKINPVKLHNFSSMKEYVNMIRLYSHYSFTLQSNTHIQNPHNTRCRNKHRYWMIAAMTALILQVYICMYISNTIVVSPVSRNYQRLTTDRFDPLGNPSEGYDKDMTYDLRLTG